MNTRALIILTLLISGLILILSVGMNQVVDRYEPIMADLENSADIGLALRDAKDSGDIVDMYRISAELYTRHTHTTRGVVSLIGMIRAATHVLYWTAGLNVAIVAMSIVLNRRSRRRNKAQPGNSGDG